MKKITRKNIAFKFKLWSNFRQYSCTREDILKNFHKTRDSITEECGL